MLVTAFEAPSSNVLSTKINICCKLFLLSSFPFGKKRVQLRVLLRLPFYQFAYF